MGMWLKSAKVWGCPITNGHVPGIVYSKTLGQLSLLPSLFSVLVFTLKTVLEISRQILYKCVQPIGEIFPTPPLSFVGHIHHVFL
jgi:hypothetical protein